MKAPLTNNKGVIDAWKCGESARNSRRNLTTDGESLYSYRLKIGMRAGETCVVADYTAGTNSFQTQTTSCHVGIARARADLVMHPRVWLTSPLSAEGSTGEELPF
tara:strand:+ start:362 stop:676 length:315 start_codon:yes stop_codon:yes gene_type:complete